MKKLKLLIVTAALLLGGVMVMPSVAMAQADRIQSGVNRIDGEGQQPTLEDQIEIIVNILLFVLGAIAVIMIIIGGIRYATAGGDQSALTAAKNTILYAVIGLVVAIMAYGIVGFVLRQF